MQKGHWIKTISQLETVSMLKMKTRKREILSSMLAFSCSSNSWMVEWKFKIEFSQQKRLQRSCTNCGTNWQKNSWDKLPTISSQNNRQGGSPNVVVSTESPNSDDIKNTSRNTNTKIIKKVFVLGDSMVKHIK